MRVMIIMGRTYASLCIGLLSLMVIGSSHVGAGSDEGTPFPERPNILLITAEHIRIDNIAEHGYPWMQTPNLDRLVREGTSMTGAFIVGVACAPNRASLFTGRYPQHHGVRSNGVRLPETETTLTHVLQDAGYYTGQFGKLHFLPHENRNHRGYHPPYGFDEMLISETNGLYEDDYARWLLAQSKEAREIARVPPPEERSFLEYGVFPGDEGLLHASWVGNETAAFIQRNVDRPWFAHAGFHAAHTSYLNPPASQLEKYEGVELPKRQELPVAALDSLPGRYKNRIQSGAHITESEWISYRRYFYAKVSEVDEQVGHILETLEENGILENTIIIFTSDHGEYLGDHGLKAKGDLVYDTVFNVPLIYRGPGVSDSGVTPELVSLVDVMPTILDLLQIPSPLGIKGESHRSLLEGAGSGRDYVYAEGPSMRMIRTSSAKYAVHPDGEVLFDLEDDPKELHNHAIDPTREELLDEMRKLMREIDFELWDELPEREASY